MAPKPVLKVVDLKTHLRTKSGVVKAVDGVSFDIHEGETLGIIGESGSGKSMTALSILRLLPNAAQHSVDGQVLLDGEELLTKPEAEMTRIRGNQISMILQDPMTALNPVLTIGDQMTEAPRHMDKLGRKASIAKAIDLLRKVRVSAPESRLGSYPHQLSGGMRQRVVGAIGISRSPRVLIADEPTTSLDATVQLQLLQLLKAIQQEYRTSILFITHDFGIVARMCDRVAVMYAGRIVEIASTQDLFTNPTHPYTQGLMRSVPDLEADVDELPSIAGHPPDLELLPQGCSFEPRCPVAQPRCTEEYPPEFSVGGRHTSSCWQLDKASVAGTDDVS